eukprot:scaffold7040_cov256-Pinguiococcus_pyrenoidosus.AAC.11
MSKKPRFAALCRHGSHLIGPWSSCGAVQMRSASSTPETSAGPALGWRCSVQRRRRTPREPQNAFVAAFSKKTRTLPLRTLRLGTRSPREAGKPSLDAWRAAKRAPS